MLQFLVTLQSFVADRIERDDKGATAVEYGLMVALIAVAIIAAVTTLGGQLSTLFTDVAEALGFVAPAPAA
jgi:pilus assembly protein Flp/PilA